MKTAASNNEVKKMCKPVGGLKSLFRTGKSLYILVSASNCTRHGPVRAPSERHCPSPKQVSPGLQRTESHDPAPSPRTLWSLDGQVCSVTGREMAVERGRCDSRARWGRGQKTAPSIVGPCAEIDFGRGAGLCVRQQTEKKKRKISRGALQRCRPILSDRYRIDSDK